MTLSSVACGRLPPMEFQEVVRRRRMVRNYDPDRPVPPEVRERILANALRAPSAGFSQGWAFLVLESAADRYRASGRRPPRDRAGPLAHRHAAGAADHRPAVTTGGVPRPVRGARQGLDRQGRGPLAGALLAHRHRLRRAADAADRGGRGAGGVLLRRAAGADSTATGRPSASPTSTCRSGLSPSATGHPTAGRRRSGAGTGQSRTSSTAAPGEPAVTGPRMALTLGLNDAPNG